MGVIKNFKDIFSIPFQPSPHTHLSSLLENRTAKWSEMSTPQILICAQCVWCQIIQSYGVKKNSFTRGEFSSFLFLFSFPAHMGTDEKADGRGTRQIFAKPLCKKKVKTERITDG